MLNDQQVQILNLAKDRKNTPIDLIAQEIFSGDRQQALTSINDLEKQRMIEYPVVNMIRVTPAGKDILKKNSLNKN